MLGFAFSNSVFIRSAVGSIPPKIQKSSTVRSPELGGADPLGPVVALPPGEEVAVVDAPQAATASVHAMTRAAARLPLPFMCVPPPNL
jgi:ribosomal protein L16/L10AE